MENIIINGVEYILVAKNKNPDWEIVSFAFKSDPYKVYNKRESGYWWENKFKVSVTGEPSTEYAEIKSVRRLSDNEVFSIDDITNQGKITGFHYIGTGEMFVDFENNLRYCRLNELKKIKPILLTTEEGIPMYEGDSCWRVNSFYDCYQEKVLIRKHPLYSNKYFTTEELAKNHIKKHKPIYNEDDLRKAFYAPIRFVETAENDFTRFDHFEEYLKSLNK